MVMFLAGEGPISNFQLVQNFIFYAQVLVTAIDWAEDLCSHWGVQGQEVSRLGLKTGTGTRCSVSLQFAFLGADGIFTSVNDGYILDISLIYLGYMWRIYCCILFKRYI